jgi:hypothetical protein
MLLYSNVLQAATSVPHRTSFVYTVDALPTINALKDERQRNSNATTTGSFPCPYPSSMLLRIHLFRTNASVALSYSEPPLLPTRTSIFVFTPCSSSLPQAPCHFPLSMDQGVPTSSPPLSLELADVNARDISMYFVVPNAEPRTLMAYFSRLLFVCRDRRFYQK